MEPTDEILTDAELIPSESTVQSATPRVARMVQRFGTDRESSSQAIELNEGWGGLRLALLFWEGESQMSLDYVEEKLLQAIDSLIGEGSSASRLTAAALYLVNLDENDFDKHERLWDDLRSIVADVTKIEPSVGGGAVRATVQGMSNEELGRMAKRIHSLYRSVMKAK
jgi:hypothetical protein